MSATRVQSAVTCGPAAEIPDKLYFKIGEVATLVGVESHVLRYWEKEVASIRPGKSASNQRRYRRRDVELFREIKRLLYDEKYTLAGARKRLASVGDAPARGRRRQEEPTLLDDDPDLVQLTETATPAVIQPAAQVPQAPPAPAARLDPRLERVRAGLQDLLRLAGG